MKRRVIPIVAAVVLAAGYSVCCAAVDEEHILPHTLVNGIDISGMEVQEAVSLLERDTDSRQSTAVITVRFAEKEYPVDVAAEQECRSVVEDIQKPARGAFFARGFFLIKSFLIGNAREASLVLKDEEVLEEAIKASGLLDEGTTEQTVYQIEEDNLVFTIGTAGEEADSVRLKEELKSAVLAGDDTIECPVSKGRVEAVDIDSVYQEIYQEPENAALDPENNYQIKESSAGRQFDKESARKALEEAEEGSTVTIKLIMEEPEITTADL